MKKLLILGAMLGGALCGFARGEAEPEPLRPVLSAYTARIGSQHTADTYISPIRYAGVGFGFGYERMQAMKFNPERWVMDLRLDASGAHTTNPAGNGTIWQAGLSAGWGMMHRWQMPQGFTLYLGGTTDLDLGMLYNVRNSNNPVAAKASWTVGVMGAAAWNGRIGRLPVCLRYQATMPLTGIFFSPDYGELYYEIYLGNRSGLVHGAWPGNFFRLDNLLTADLRFGATIVRLGYRLDYNSSKACDIVSRGISHSFVVGFASEWISLSASRTHEPDARIISALY